MADTVVEKPRWQEWLVGIVGALLVSAVVSGVGLYASSEVTKAQLKGVSDAVDKMALKVEKISGQVAGTESAIGILTNTLERSVREQMAAQDRRISASEARANELADQVGKLRETLAETRTEVTLLRRASEEELRRRGLVR